MCHKTNFHKFHLQTNLLKIWQNYDYQYLVTMRNITCILNEFYPKNDISAWDDDEPTNENKKLTLAQVFLDYTEYSTIQGLAYIFFSYQIFIGRVFWSLILTLLFTLGMYWCQQAYMDWTENPVLTTVTTTSYSINEVIMR